MLCFWNIAILIMKVIERGISPVRKEKEKGSQNKKGGDLFLPQGNWELVQICNEPTKDETKINHHSTCFFGASRNLDLIL